MPSAGGLDQAARWLRCVGTILTPFATAPAMVEGLARSGLFCLSGKYLSPGGLSPLGLIFMLCIGQPLLRILEELVL